MDHKNLKIAIDFFNYFTLQPLDATSYVLESKQQKIMVRTHLLPPEDHDSLEEIMSLMDIHLSFNQSYVSPLLHFQKCQFGIRAFYRMDKLSLKEDIQNRMQNQLFFEEKQLWTLLMSVVDSLIYLQNKESLYGALSSSKIFVADGCIRLMDPTAFNLNPMTISRMSICSPELTTTAQQIDFHQSDVYLLGVCLLQAATLTFIKKDSGSESIMDLISSLQERYSSEIIHVLGYLLKENPQQRPSFQDIKEYIESEIKVEKDLCPAELLTPDFQDYSQYLQNCSLLEDLEHIDRLEQMSQKENLHQPTQYQQARLKYLDSPPSKENKQIPSTIDTSKSISSRRQSSIQSKKHKKTQQNKEIKQFQLKLETVNKKPKLSKALQIKNRNAEQVKKLQSVCYDNCEYPFTDPSLRTMIQQQREKAKEHLKASYYR